MGTRRGVPAGSAPLLKRRESLVVTAWSGRREMWCELRAVRRHPEADPEVTVRLATWFVNPPAKLTTRGAGDGFVVGLTGRRRHRAELAGFRFDRDAALETIL